MHIRDTYEFKRIQQILDTIHYSDDARLNYFYHMGFLMAAMARAAQDDSGVLDYLEESKRRLVENGWRQRGSEVSKTQSKN